MAALSTSSIEFADATELLGLIKTRKVSPVEVVDYFLARIESENPKYNAFLTICADEARSQAKEAEAELARGGDSPPLYGLPIAVKDLESTKGIRTTLGSLIYRDWVPDEDSIVVERLRRAGVIILGKTNTPEFGASATTENRLGDHCRNPWDTRRTTGGSSGGAGAALVAGLCPLATGSDGGGSIRIPSSLCGVYGIKATHGRVPTANNDWPLFADSGPMSLSVRDSALTLSLIAGRDSRDPLSIRRPVPDYVKSLNADIKGLRVAWSSDLGYAAVDEEVLSISKSAADLFEDFGCGMEEATPKSGDPFEIFATIASAEDYALNGHLLEDHADDLVKYVKSTLEYGQKVTGAEYAKAMRALWQFQSKMEDFFEDYDLLLTPATAVPAFPVGERPTMIGGREVGKLWGFTPFTPTFNLTGNPAASVPCGFSSEGLPIGLQIVGRRGDEVSVLRASAALERARPWKTRID